MTTPTHHTVTLVNRFGNPITAPVVYVKALGDGRADVHVETNFYIEAGYANPATYTVPGNATKGTYTVSGSEFTERQTYIYKGIFVR